MASMVKTHIKSQSFTFNRIEISIGFMTFVCLISMLFSCQQPTKSVEVPDEHRFRVEVLTEETMDPTAISISDNGKIFYAEDVGVIKVYHPITNSVSVVGELPVFTCGEEGLIGMVLDADFRSNGWLYVNRTISGYMDLPCGEIYSNPDLRFNDSTSFQAISRFTVVNDTLDMSSEQVLLKIPVQHMRHVGGSLAFDGSGNLYISVGENTHPGFINAYAPLDERPGKENYDTQRTSTNTMDFRGKILRIHPEDDGSYSIPEGNLFSKDDPLALPEIYVMGCRNPFRISVDQPTGTLYWGEVGPDAYADIARGPMGYDEINKTTEGGFFGWPYFIADNQAYARFNYDTQESGALFDAAKPENTSPNNTGKKVLPAAKPAFIWYPYVASQEFPELGDGGRTAMAGPVYHYDAELDSDIKFPSYFDKALFIYDWMRGWIKVVRMDGSGALSKIENFMPSTRFVGPIDMQFGPDGSLYVMEFGTTWGANPDARLVRITYVKGNRAPVVHISADKTEGACPMTVNFSSEGTIDYDKSDQLTYAWQFDSGEKQSNEKHPRFVFDTPGVYTVKLTVTDSEGASSTSEVTIKAGNDPPKLSIEMPNRGSFYWDSEQIPYTIKLEDKEDGSLATGGIDPSDVQVVLERLEGIYTLETTAEGTGGLKSQGEKLIGESDCSSCHKEKDRAIGPSFLEIAQRYQEQSNRTDYIAGKIISGGSGVWGEISMSAHPLFSTADAAKMADYILSLAGAETNVTEMGERGAIGTLANDEQHNITYVLRASYTDRGSSGMDPITVSKLRVLQPPKLEAENFSTHRDMLSEAGAKSISMGFSSTYISFKHIDLSNVDSVRFRYSYKGPECFIAVRTRSPEGELIGEARFTGNPEIRGYRELTIPIKETHGAQELFFLHDKAPDIHEEIGLDWIYFHKNEPQ